MPPETNNLKPVELLRGLVLSTSGTAVEKASHKKHARLFASSGEGIAGNNTQKAILDLRESCYHPIGSL
jgi:hypothetical protein